VCAITLGFTLELYLSKIQTRQRTAAIQKERYKTSARKMGSRPGENNKITTDQAPLQRLKPLGSLVKWKPKPQGDSAEIKVANSEYVQRH
jgi:hypothetical protein